MFVPLEGTNPIKTDVLEISKEPMLYRCWGQHLVKTDVLEVSEGQNLVNIDVLEV